MKYGLHLAEAFSSMEEVYFKIWKVGLGCLWFLVLSCFLVQLQENDWDDQNVS